MQQSTQRVFTSIVNTAYVGIHGIVTDQEQ